PSAFLWPRPSAGGPSPGPGFIASCRAVKKNLPIREGGRPDFSHCKQWPPRARSPDMNDRSPAEEHFFAALEKGTPEERAAYLEEACAGNETLRRQVETLLAAHAEVGHFLERPIAEAEGMAALGSVETAAADHSFLAPSTEPGSIGRLDH